MALCKKQSRALLITTGFGLLLIAYIWTGLLQQQKEEKAHILEAAIQRNSNLAVAMEQYAIRTIHNADALLQMVKREYEMKGENILVHQLLRDRNADSALLDGVSLIDEEGDLISSSYPITRAGKFNFKDREHFIVHKNNKERGLYIGKPLISRTLNKPMIPFSRRLNHPDGSFGGIVSVQISPSVFTRLYRNATLRPNDIISFIAPDNGTTYSRRTGSRESYGENISKSPLFQYLAEKPVGHYFAKDAIRGIPTYFSYRKLDRYPMITTVGTSASDVFLNFNQRVAREKISALLLSAFILIFCLLIGWILVARKQHLDRVKESEIKYRSIFENSLEAILIVQPGGSIIAANPAASRFFKMTAEQLCNSNFSLLTCGDALTHHYLQTGRPDESFKEEWLFQRSNGMQFPGEMTSALYKDVQGREQWIIIIRDITLRKRLSEKRQAEQKRYQRKVTEQVIQAQEREREHIGRELHDNVNQVLTTVKLYLEMAINHKDLREELLPKTIGHVVQSINEIRNLSRDLSAPTLGTQSIIDSISALVEMVQSSSGLCIQFEYSSYRNLLNKDQKLALYRIVQEQLNNVIKHAGATEVDIYLGQEQDTTWLSVRDNGRGFDPTQKRTGIGINNIISRARVFDGVATIESAPGSGTRLLVQIPLPDGSMQKKDSPEVKAVGKNQ